MRLSIALGLAAALWLGGMQTAFAHGGHGNHGHGKKNAAKGKQTLFKKLGGKKAITAVVNDFVGRCANDTRINSFFAATAADPKRLAKFKGNLVAQICEASGGPCKYKGKDMKTAHQGMGVQEDHFNALVENLTATLNQFKVGKKEQGQLLAVLGPMKGDIVEPGVARDTASEAGAPPTTEE